MLKQSGLNYDACGIRFLKKTTTGDCTNGLPVSGWGITNWMEDYPIQILK